MLKKVLIFLYCVLIFNNSLLNAQEKDKIKLRFGAELTSQMSYSGLSSGVQINLLHQKHSLGIGTKITYQSSFFPYQNALGLIVDYKFFLISKNNMKAFVELNYNNSIYKSLRQGADKNNIIHEYTYSNRILIKVVENLWIGNSMGVGAYTENYYDYSGAEYGSYLGYNVMFKINLSYEI